MHIGPKYKIARRLGAGVFEKTQTQKYAFHLERKAKKHGLLKPRSEFAIQLTEKQKARFSYGISEKQFANYVKRAVLQKSPDSAQIIYELLESRLDNIIYRLGFAKTRLFARQMVSHGHITVNGRRVNVPSRKMSLGDKIEIREGSSGKALFASLNEQLKETTVPSWITFDQTKKSAVVSGRPKYIPNENLFDLNTVIEYYSK